MIPNPWDIGSARILAQLGFRALATTSAGLAFSLGLPDRVTSLSRARVLDHLTDLVEYVVIGRVARPDEIKAYFKDPEDKRRSLLVERLLASEDYPRHWADMWSNWLLTRSGPLWTWVTA